MKILLILFLPLAGLCGYLAGRNASALPELKTDFNWQTISKLDGEIRIKNYYELDGQEVLHGDQYIFSKTENRDNLTKIVYQKGKLKKVDNFYSSPHPGKGWEPSVDELKDNLPFSTSPAGH